MPYNAHMTFDAARVLYATSTIADGNMSMRYGDHAEVVHHRERFLEKKGGSLDECVVMQLEHGDVVTRVGATDRGKGARTWGEGIFAEALMTNEPGVTLFMLTADCLPLAYYDPKHHAIALAHLGWKPTDLHLALKVVEEMHKEFGSDPADIRVTIGPGIRKESYIQKEVLQKESSKWKYFLKEMSNGETSINLVGYNIAVLVAAGIDTKHITSSTVDTVKDPNYFSHYRATRTGEPEGRFATILGLK